MTPQIKKFYPLIARWLRETLTAHAHSARAVASCGFLGLPLYFKAETLSSAKVVVLDRLPMPPLSSWGLTQFADFERGDPDGVAYLDTFFLKPAPVEEVGNSLPRAHSRAPVAGSWTGTISSQVRGRPRELWLSGQPAGGHGIQRGGSLCVIDSPIRRRAACCRKSRVRQPHIICRQQRPPFTRAILEVVIDLRPKWVQRNLNS